MKERRRDFVKSGEGGREGRQTKALLRLRATCLGRGKSFDPGRKGSGTFFSFLLKKFFYSSFPPPPRPPLSVCLSVCLWESCQSKAKAKRERERQQKLRTSTLPPLFFLLSFLCAELGPALTH